MGHDYALATLLAVGSRGRSSLASLSFSAVPRHLWQKANTTVAGTAKPTVARVKNSLAYNNPKSRSIEFDRRNAEGRFNGLCVLSAEAFYGLKKLRSYRHNPPQHWNTVSKMFVGRVLIAKGRTT
jgi:hypothetical protein